MAKRQLARKTIIDAFVKTFGPLEYAHALWEAGAASFKRIDEWSDIDLYLVVDDERVEDAFKAMEKMIESLGSFSLRFRLPEPTWHGHSQVFYQLKRASPFLYIDICIMKKGSKDKFLQFAIHEIPKVYFDKSGIVKDDPVDIDAFVDKLVKRLKTLKTTFNLFQTDTLKELNRGNYVEAFAYYMGGTYRPLLEAIRIKYTPLHFNFGGRYAHYELPPDVVRKLREFLYIKDMKELRKRHTDAGKWFNEIVDSIGSTTLRKLVCKK